jgi:hypothetical protein
MSAKRFEVIKETDKSRPCRLYIRSGCRNVLASVNDDPQTIELFTLFAAAPEMLDVLKELDECATYWSEYDVPIGIHDRIKAAIAKAEGRAEG